MHRPGMWRPLHLLISLAILAGVALATGGVRAASDTAVSASAREEAYRLNNLGVGQLEQYAYAQAADKFREAVAKDPQLAIAHLNLAIALLNVPDMEAAGREAEWVVANAPERPQGPYVLGLAERGQNHLPEALAAFAKVLALDPDDAGANVNSGQIHMQERQFPEAIAAFRRALSAEPYNATAVYNLAMALNRSGASDEAGKVMAQFQALRTAGHGSTLGQVYAEQGHYAEALVSTGLEPELVEKEPPAVRLSVVPLGTTSVRRSTAPAARADDGGLALVDYDGDGALDVVSIGAAGRALFRNDKANFVDATAATGLRSQPTAPAGAGVLAGDYDNDGHVDLFILSDQSSRLLRGEGKRFVDVTKAAGLPETGLAAAAAAFVDLDHDGDLDLVVAGSSVRIFRNNGNATFTEVTDEARLPKLEHVVAIVPTDYDNRRDVDLLLLDERTGPHVLANLRDGTFREMTAAAKLNVTGSFTAVAAGDINKDGYVDFFLARRDDRALLAMSDGKGHYDVSVAPEETRNTTAALCLDVDNDGLLDLAGVSGEDLYILRNVATGWTAVEREHVGAVGARGLVAGDLDGDGDTDLAVRTLIGQTLIVRNETERRFAAETVRLVGRGTNRAGIGSKVELRAGSLRQRTELMSATPAPQPVDLLFGLGRRSKVDVVRVLWPSGILQAETDIAAPSATITELDRKPSSCPFLYTWNGERFEFVTDFLGAGEMGYWEGPGAWSHPDPDEYVRIRSDQLRPRNGRLDLRVTNELEEVLYLDRAELLVVTHPRNVEVYPNEGMIAAPGRPFQLFAARDARPPLHAFDDNGRDLSDRIARLDRRFADGFELLSIRGYAAEHTLTLDLGAPRAGRTLLLLTGWTDYAFSTDNFAAHQSGLTEIAPVLEVPDDQGGWRVAIPEVGVPVGRPQTIVLDLTDVVTQSQHEVRIRTNMRVYWDQILVATADESVDLTPKRLVAATADLHWRGFAAEGSPDGREPFGYDYARVSAFSPWKVFPGRYTREGDVRELLTAVDDRFVIARSGDEISLSFDATSLPPLPNGFTRTYLLYADGFSKEMDLHSASPDVVTPLPFHGMSRYPYGPEESYPLTPERRDYLDRYNTRVVTAPWMRLEAELLREAAIQNRR